MRYPEFFEVTFGNQKDEEFTKRDAALNSDMLREVCDLIRPVYKDGQFSTGRAWRVRIEDQHAGEEKPHYVLDFGETDCGERADIYTKNGATIKVGYCDNHSVAYGVAGFMQGPSIIQESGTFTVYAGGDFGNYAKQLIAIAVARAYVKSLERHFPDYFILVDDRQLMYP